MHKVCAELAGKTFTGWTDISVNYSMDQLCGSFDMTLSQAGSELLESDWTKKLVVWLDHDNDRSKIITGYVDRISASVDNENISYRISGRSITSDLIDSTTTEDLDGQTLKSIINRELAKHDIKALFQVEGNTVEKYAPSSTKIWDALEEQIKNQNLLAYTNEEGQFVLAKPGSGNAHTVKLKQGLNILSVQVNRSIGGFSDYVVYGEAESFLLKSKIQVRNRKLELKRPDLISVKSCKERANFELKRYRAREHTLNITVPGWLAGNEPWGINRLVELDFEFQGISGTRLIKEVNFELDKNQWQTSLTLIEKEVYG